jgi:biopolymer transport protein TolR
MRRRIREEDEIGELNIVPYLDIVTNLVMFLLVSMIGLISLGVLDVGTPKIGEPSAAESKPAEKKENPPLLLTVAISNKGFFVAGTGGVLPGDTGANKGVDTALPPTVPRKNGQYDYAALTDLLVLIKEKFPNESRVILVAEDDIAYDLIIQTMDACREKKTKGTGGGEVKKLFPDVWLSTMRS